MAISREIDLNELNALEKDFESKSNRMKKKLEKMNVNYRNDVRFTTFSTLSSVIRSLELYFTCRGLDLLENDWWNDLIKVKRFPINESSRKDDINKIIKDFDSFINVGLFISTFSIVESRLRVIYYHVINQKGFGNINYHDSIFKIYTDLYKHAAFSAKEYYAIELFRIIRNTNHNNGVFTKENPTPRFIKDNNNFFISEGSGSIKITFDGHKYSFERGYVPDFENSMNLLIQRILPIVTDSLYKIIDGLSSLTNEITDPFLNSNKAV